MIFHSSKEWTVAVAHILGFPRIGAKRELKAALESFWRGELPESELLKVGRELRGKHWQWQRDAGLDFVTVGDFAWYDTVLQTLAHLGCVPERFGFDPRALTLPDYFTLARGDANHPAMEMTKWFDTNYHYLVPEWSSDTRFDGGVEWLFEEVKQAKELGHPVKVALIGPLTLLHAGKIKSGLSSKLDLLTRMVPAYQRLLARLKELEVGWVQIDEPVLGLDLEERWLAAFPPTYEALAPSSPKILLATYFESVAERDTMLKSLPVSGIHLDLVRAPQQLATFLNGYPESKVLSSESSTVAISGAPIWMPPSWRSNRCMTGSANGCGSLPHARCSTCRWTSRTRERWMPRSAAGWRSRCKSSLRSRRSSEVSYRVPRRSRRPWKPRAKRRPRESPRIGCAPTQWNTVWTHCPSATRAGRRPSRRESRNRGPD